MVRFFQEVFNEVVICLMISFSTTAYSDSNNVNSKVSWVVSIVLAGLCIGCLCQLCLLFVRGGPYVEGSFEPGQLKRSFWHYRELHHSLIPLPDSEVLEDVHSEPVPD